jgi:methylglutamate dehydrogenase subunit C
VSQTKSNPPRSGTCAEPNRLATGGQIDRTLRLAFRFDGERCSGFAGDTLASALLASGRLLVGRSFKYHRPRGILTADSTEPNALVELRSGARREPNTRATLAELYDGLEARSQNRWPSLRFDLGALASLLAPLLVAGFYYKTFMWPPTWWERLYEPLIRRASGLGRASTEADPDRYEIAHAFCDLLVVGAGAAGLAAALAASRAGARVILCEEDFLLGGRLNGDRREIDGAPALAWARAVEAELGRLPGVRILRRTAAFGIYDAGRSGARTVGALERVADHLAAPGPRQPRQRLWKIVARHILLATGATERPLSFEGNDRPGILLASAVRTYVNRFAVAPGRRLALYTTTDDGWRTARDLAQAGVPLSAIIDARESVSPALRATGAKLAARVLIGARVTATRGARQLRAIDVRDATGRSCRLRVDGLAVSGGWEPSLALATHVGCPLRWSDAIGAFVPGTMPRGMAAIGAANGTFALADVLEEAAAAATATTAGSGHPEAAPPRWQTDEEDVSMQPLWPSSGARNAFVDLQNDVTVSDVELAAREGFRSPEHLKRYTTLGMGTDQGKLSTLNGVALMARLSGRTIAELGTPRARPPYTPVSLGALAGPHRGTHFRPTRRTPAHQWAEECGAHFVESGLWRRAQWFAGPGESDWQATVIREAAAVRHSVGVCDISTLGKLEIAGADAATFLDRIYVNEISRLAIGRVRYGIMLREDGFVLDDGTAARLDAERFLVSTTTANADRVKRHLEHAAQVLWPELDAQIADVTEQWAQFAIAGPHSRALLQSLLPTRVDVSNAALPYLGCTTFSWQGIELRLFRISFCGELAYELAAPSRHGDALAREIMRAGERFGVTPYGIEALGVLRIEKGHLGGAEMNGTTTAADLGLARLLSSHKSFIGEVLSRRPGLTDPARQVLVGLRPLNTSQRLHAGAHLLAHGAPDTLESSQGHLTSVAFSPALGHWIGLGLLTRGVERSGERLRALDPLRGAATEVQVVSPVFIDPEGARVRA